MRISKKIFIFLLSITVAMPVSCVKYFAVGSESMGSGGRIDLYKVGEWRNRIKTIKLSKNEWPNKLLFSPYGKYLACVVSASKTVDGKKIVENKKLVVYRTSKWQDKAWERYFERTYEDEIKSISFSSSGKLFAVGLKNKIIVFRKDKESSFVVKDVDVKEITFIRDDYLAGLLHSKKKQIVRIWKTDSWGAVRDIPAYKQKHQKMAGTTAIQSEGETVIKEFRPKGITVHKYKSAEESLESGQPETFFKKGYQYGIMRSITCSLKGDMAITSDFTSSKGAYGDLVLYNTKNWQMGLRALGKRLATEYQLATFSPSGKYIALCLKVKTDIQIVILSSKLQVLKRFYIRKDLKVKKKELTFFEPKQFAFSFDDKYLAFMAKTGATVNSYYIFRKTLILGKWELEKKSTAGWYSAIAFSPEIRVGSIKSKKKKKKNGDIEEIIKI